MKNIWTTESGEEIKFKDLKDSHLLAILNGGFACGSTFKKLYRMAENRNLDVREAKKGKSILEAIYEQQAQCNGDEIGQQ